ncbi:MAG: WH2 domain-containing protein [Candidatus Paracaedibacter sp.]
MLSRKKSFLLNTIVISFLMSGSYTTLGKVSDSWEKMASQPTESQKTADAARAEREKELQAIRDSKKEPTSEENTPLEPMKKPAEPSEPTPTKPHVSHSPSATSSPVEKRRTLQEQIALNKQKKAEDLRKLHEMNKEKATAHSTAKHTAKSEEDIAMSPSQRKLMSDLDKKAADEPMKKTSNPPAPLKEAPKPIAMSPTQKKLTEKMDAEERKKLTGTTHPVVNLAPPPLKMQVEEHEEITLPMPKKVSKPTTPQIHTKVEPAKAGSSKDALLAQIRKGVPLKPANQAFQPAEWEPNSGQLVRAGELVMDLKRSKGGIHPTHAEMVQHLITTMPVTATQAEKVLEEMGL